MSLYIDPKYSCWMRYFRSRFIIIVSVLLSWGCTGVPKLTTASLDAIARVDCIATSCIDFIYIHGAAHHSEEVDLRFRKQINLLHHWMQASLNSTPEFVSGVLNDGHYRINPAPKIDFWGNERLLMQDLDSVNWMLTNEMRSSPRFLVGQRERLAVDIHDLFWVGHSHRQPSLLAPLHKQVKASAALGRPVVLLGHSAGSMIAANYALYRVPFVELNELAQLPQVSQTLRELTSGRDQATCLAALFAADLIELGPDGKMIATLEGTTAVDHVRLDEFRRQFWSLQIGALPKYTAAECAKPGDIKGIVGFGTMAGVLLSKARDAEGMLLALLLRYLYSHDMFWLTVNHADDPVSFSTYNEEQIPERIENVLKMSVTLSGGFFVSAKPTYRGATFLSAHSWYLTSPSEFAKLLATTFADGYQRFVLP